MGDGSWRYAHYIYEIRELVAKLGVTLYHVCRNHNVMADSLANWEVGLTSNYCDPLMFEGGN